MIHECNGLILEQLTAINPLRYNSHLYDWTGIDNGPLNNNYTRVLNEIVR